MAQAEPSYVTSFEDGSAPLRDSAHSSVPGDQYVTASASSSSSLHSYQCVTASMNEQEIVSLIEKSREQGWTELADGAADAAAASLHSHDAVIWEELKELYPHDFFFDVGAVKLGRLIAEGGQAHIYEASARGDDREFVAKVFKKGIALADLKRQWPLSNNAPEFSHGNFVFGDLLVYCNLIYCGTLLEDGRFAFLMKRYAGDLRTLINLKLSDNNSKGPPFSRPQALEIMLQIAWGMRELRRNGVLHRDLKAANILFQRSGDELVCQVADYESSMFVQGTGFWRAPEVLKELQKKESERNVEIWTEKGDVYGYAMTCYEVLTGGTPFEGYFKSDWEKVINGERPVLPDYVDCRVGELVERCWHSEPSERPSFEVIADELEDISGRSGKFGSSLS